MINIDKKKRNTSGSRSKSRKSKYNDFSVELKPHKVSQTIASHEHTSKQKTDNSLNKSKGSRKHSKPTKKTKVTKTSKAKMFEQSKQISRSVSAQRKNTLTKMNRTQANFQSEDFQHKIYALKKNLSKIEKPSSINSRQISQFYQQIHDSVELISQPLYSFFCFLHNLYVSPINQILDMISPYEQLLRKKQMLNRSVEQQVKHNQLIYSKLQQQDLTIIRLKQKIEQQKQLIDQKRQQQQQRRHKKQQQIQTANKNMRKQKTIIQNILPSKLYEKSETIKDGTQQKVNNGVGCNNSSSMKQQGKGLKINLASMDRANTMNFHDEFYSKIDQFSESWRDQALREKKF